MEILFVATDFVWPPTSGGRVRTLSQLRVLGSLPEVHRIRFFSLSEDTACPAQRRALEREVPKLEVLEPVFHPVHLLSHRRYLPRVAWLRIARGVPYVAGKWDSPTAGPALERELLAVDPDLVWLDGLGSAHYLPLVRRVRPRARVILDQHNVESERFAQFAVRQRGVLRRLAEAEWRAALRFERDALRSADAVGAISPDDARAYRKLAGIEALTVPQVVPFARRRPPSSREPRLCYVGSLGWEPNVRGLDWFCLAVWPLVRERLPEARLEIVGTGLATDGRGAVLPPLAWRAPGLTTRGFLEDLTPLYERSAAMVAPVLGGSGIRIKLLEAFRHGMPVVTTPDGAAGLPIEPGREAFVESEPSAFAARVVEVATSLERQIRMREAGYTFLEGHHGLGAAQAVVRALIDRARDRHAAAAHGVGSGGLALGGPGIAGDSITNSSNAAP